MLTKLHSLHRVVHKVGDSQCQLWSPWKFCCHYCLWCPYLEKLRLFWMCDSDCWKLLYVTRSVCHQKICCDKYVSLNNYWHFMCKLHFTQTWVVSSLEIVVWVSCNVKTVDKRSVWDYERDERYENTAMVDLLDTESKFVQWLQGCKKRAHSVSWPEVVKAVPNQGLDCFVS